MMYPFYFSSRFTDSKRYEASFDRCFDLDGEIRVSRIIILWRIYIITKKYNHLNFFLKLHYFNVLIFRLVRYVTRVCYWSKDSLSYPKIQIKIGTMSLTPDVVQASKVWCEEKTKTVVDITAKTMSILMD